MGALLSEPPQIGQLAEIRARQWVVAEVEADQLPTNGLKPDRPRQHLVTLRAVDDDAEPDETLRVVWEIEPDTRMIERAGLPVPDALDEPARFDAFLDAVRWGAVDHLIPIGAAARLGYPAEWVRDTANLVTACRAWNEFLNGYKVTDPPPATVDKFFDLRDRHFLAKLEWVLTRHATERASYDAALRPPSAEDV